MLHAVVMSGGSGTRFWPRSREAVPKQLLPLLSDRSMIRETVDRVRPWISPEHTWVVTNEKQLELTADELPEVATSQILIEPEGRNTAPCIGLAALALTAIDPEAVMLVMPADHVIQPEPVFHEAVVAAARAVAEDPSRFALFGVPPTYPSVSYGYIERGEAVADNLFRVASFREKPPEDVAKEYLQSERFYWNCGIFVWRADRLLAALKDFEPEMHELLESLRPAFGTLDWQAKLEEVFPRMKSVAIDVAVMEKAAKKGSGYDVLVIEAPFEWDDVGAWQSLPRRIGQDERGNTVQGRFCGIDTTDSIISTSKDHLVATFGIDNLIIVHTKDATLVARKDDENAVKQLIAKLRKEGHERFL